MGNILCFGLCLLLNLVIISRVIPSRPRFAPIFLKPLAASALMGGSAWAVYGLLSRVLGTAQVNELGETVRTLGNTGNAVATLAAILVAMAVYGVLIIALRAISKEDLALMPKGEKLARFLHL